ncbi:MAG: FkbM family methyltransferase [Fulvivirga sp.]|nr:FkbM family methyltransferase [Fulvivirga sp.]
MSKSKNKIKRYKALISKINNWPDYLWKKITGFDKEFVFDVKNFGKVKVPRNMLGPFRENFLDDIYLRNIPADILNDKKEPVVLDIGANVGYFSLAIFANYPTARVYSFEPHPYCFKVLEDYKKQYQNLDFNTVEKAVSDTNQEIPLFISKDKDFTTTSSIFDSANKDTKKIMAKAVKLEDFIHEEGLDQIDLLKLDCEGSEYAILYNLSEQTFEKITALTIETHRGEEDKQHIEALNKYIEGKGYKTISLDEGYTGYIWAWKN